MARKHLLSHSVNVISWFCLPCVSPRANLSKTLVKTWMETSGFGPVFFLGANGKNEYMNADFVLQAMLVFNNNAVSLPNTIHLLLSKQLIFTILI